MQKSSLLACKKHHQCSPVLFLLSAVSSESRQWTSSSLDVPLLLCMGTDENLQFLSVTPQSSSRSHHLAVVSSEKHPLSVEDSQLGHEVEVNKGQADQQVLHQVQEWCDEAKEGDEANTDEQEGKVLEGHA